MSSTITADNQSRCMKNRLYVYHNQLPYKYFDTNEILGFKNDINKSLYMTW